MKTVIVGNGVAGMTAARRLRELDPDAGLVVFTREPYHYYYKPRLPDVVAGSVDVESLVVNPPEWYEERRIDVRLSTAVRSVDTTARRVKLDDGGETYDRLLLATGADPFVPPFPGAGLDGVFTLRTAADAVAIRQAASRAKRAVVIGGGLLGIESARGLVASGLDVVTLEVADRLLPRQLDEDGAALLTERIAALGIAVRTDATTVSIDGEGAVRSVTLKDGDVLQADIVLISAGVRPTLDVAASAGVHVERGIAVDCAMRTDVSDVYAAGDVAELNGRVWGIIPAAATMGEAAAHAIAGRETGRCGVVASNTLKISDVDVYSAGDVFRKGCVEHVWEGDGIYRKVLEDRGRIVGAIVVGSKRGVKELDRLVQHGADIERYGASIAGDDFDFGQALAAVERPERGAREAN